jgi:hypothetical protein
MDRTNNNAVGIFDKKYKRYRDRDSILRLTSECVHTSVNAARKSAYATCVTK